METCELRLDKIGSERASLFVEQETVTLGDVLVMVRDNFELLMAIRGRSVEAKNAVVGGVVTGGNLLHFDADALFCWDSVIEQTGRR